MAVRSFQLLSCLSANHEGLVTYHVEAVQDPDGWHQVQVDFLNQLLLGLRLLLKGCLGNLVGPFFVSLRRSMGYSVLLLNHSGDVTNPLYFSFPEVSIRMFGLACQRF